MAKKNGQTSAGDLRAPRHRSPNHPSLALGAAIEKASELHKKYGIHPVPLVSACNAWGYKLNSSVSNQCIAALKSYELLDVSGKGNDRKLSITIGGERIIRNAPDRDKLVQEAALLPDIHREVWDKYKDIGLPHDDILRQYLVWERPEGQRFNEDTVDGFIERFRETLSFAKIKPFHKMEGENGANDEGRDQELRRKPRRPRKGGSMELGQKEDVYALEEGEVLVRRPDRIPKEECDDLVDWLELVIRKIKRSACDLDDPASSDGE